VRGRGVGIAMPTQRLAYPQTESELWVHIASISLSRAIAGRAWLRAAWLLGSSAACPSICRKLAVMG